MKRKIYLASSWKNNLQPELVRSLIDAGHEVYDFRNPGPGEKGFSWSNVDPNWRQWDSKSFMSGIKHSVARHGYQLDKDGLDWADTCVLLLPCGKSAHLEAGYAIGQGKDTFFVAASEDKVEAELMYLLAGEDRIFLDFDSLFTRLQQDQ